MKRTIVVLVALFALQIMIASTTNGYDVNYTRVSSDEMQLDFTTNITISVVEKDGVKYSKINNAGSTVINVKGYAELPKLNATLQLGNENDVIISFADGEYTEIQLDYPLLPSRGAISRSQDPETISYEINPKSVVDAWYPKDLIESSKPFVFRDVRGICVYTYPIQYNAVKQTVRIYKSLSVGVNENLTKTTNPLTIRPEYIVSSMNSVYKSLFINYEESKFANQLGEFGEILVIYTSENGGLTPIQPYIDWKEEMGYKVSTTQVAAGTNVKTTIANAYNANPNLLYVQLVGDWADIQCDLGGDSNVPIDPMLGDVVGSDRFPELMIGRFSADSETDVTVQVDKSINYEKNPDIGGTWYSKGLGIGSNDGSGIGDDDEIDWEHVDIIKDNRLLPYTYDTVNEAYGTPTAATVAGYVNAGLSVINYCGHGAETYWVTSGYDNTDIGNSTNGSKLPFIFDVACVNGAFHWGTCFAEAWLRKSGGGAVAIIAGSENQWWVPPMVGQDYMNDILTAGYDYSANPGSGTNTTATDHRTTFGSITMNGCVLMLAEGGDTITFDTIECWTIFGDVSIQVRTDTPTLIDNSNTTLLPSNYSTTITAGGPVEGARVTLYQNGTAYTGTTDANGDVSINHDFAIASDVLVTVTGYNLETEQSVLMVTGDLGGTFSLDNSSLSYGNVTVNGTSTLQFTITNSHNTETIVGDITTITGYTVANAAKNTLSYAVPTNSSKTFDLVFSPTAQSTYSGNITITSSDPSHDPEYISVSGAGALPDINVVANISASAAPEATTQGTLDVENTGLANLTYNATYEYISWPGMKAVINAEANDFESVLGYTSAGSNMNWVTASGETWNSNTQCAKVTSYQSQSNQTSTETLTSGSFDGTICTSLTLDFDQDVTVANASSSVKVEYTDDGSAWTEIYSSSVSTTAHQQIALSNISGTMQIRFTGTIKNKTADSWAIDNIVVSGPELITYDWLRLDGGETTNGVVSPSGSDAIVVDYDATGCPLGIYTADITITSDDPDEPSEVIAVEFTVGGSTPNAPENPATTTVTASEANLTWDAVAGATTYYIYRSTDPYSGFVQIGTSATPDYQDSDVSSGNKYFYYITADNAK